MPVHFIPEKRMLRRGPPPSPPLPPPRHNFIVSAITSERFKLRSSNLTHALLIQISRTSSIIDIVVPSKVAILSKYLKKKKLRIESYLRTSKMAAGGHFVKIYKKKSSVRI